MLAVLLANHWVALTLEGFAAAESESSLVVDRESGAVGRHPWLHKEYLPARAGHGALPGEVGDKRNRKENELRFNKRL
jgi:hypothetical protein